MHPTSAETEQIIFFFFFLSFLFSFSICFWVRNSVRGGWFNMIPLHVFYPDTSRPLFSPSFTPVFLVLWIICSRPRTRLSGAGFPDGCDERLVALREQGRGYYLASTGRISGISLFEADTGCRQEGGVAHPHRGRGPTEPRFRRWVLMEAREDGTPISSMGDTTKTATDEKADNWFCLHSLFPNFAMELSFHDFDFTLSRRSPTSTFRTGPITATTRRDGEYTR
ncbi:hypothetical protein VTJ04DRAFT_712 [Mycothermus thermophilus]|uniref:uncharacterized protein n=1 Tax=Humicola insolens TaxID=85995 RepID=UPI003742CCCC